MRRANSLTNIRRIPILDGIDDIIRASQNNIILFGSVGNGKTTLLNKLCDKNYQVADEGFSCTKNIQYDFSRVLDMLIVDFPGLNSTRDFVHHLKVHKEALSSIPVKAICFVLKYSVRDDDIIREIEQMLEIFEEYTNNIVIIISKCEGISSTRKENIKYILSNDYNLKYIIFTERETNGYKLCKEINNIQRNMKNINNLRIETNNLAKYATSRTCKEISEKRKIFEDVFKDALYKFRAEVDKAKDSDLIRALYFCFKYYKDNLNEQYAEVLRSLRVKGKELEENQIVSSVLQLSNKFYNDFTDFREYIESKLEVKLNNYNGEYNKFKKCPNCGLIWFKVLGCDSVQCGKRTRAVDKFYGMYKNYKVTFHNNQINIMSTDAGDNNPVYGDEFFGLTEEEKSKNIQRKNERLCEIKPLGCGSYLQWYEMEDVSHEMIKKLQENSLKDDYHEGFLSLSEKYI